MRIVVLLRYMFVTLSLFSQCRLIFFIVIAGQLKHPIRIAKH